MKRFYRPVKVRELEVTTICDQYDNIQEAIDDLGADDALQFINSGVRRRDASHARHNTMTTCFICDGPFFALHCSMPLCRQHAGVVKDVEYHL